MSKIEVNAIEPQCGTNLTVGASGDTITFPSGTTVVNNGSQTGFGRTGTVDWDTTAKTASFTAVSGNGYFVNTTSGAITVTLPAGSANAIVAISDYASTFQTNNVTITPNGTDKINGVNDDATLSTQGIAVSLVYVDSTRGWKSVTGSDNDTTGVAPAFVTATGGNTTITCGDFKTHIFTGPGTFCVSCAGNAEGSNVMEYLVIAGGAGSGSPTEGAAYASGGGGGGGFRMFTTAPGSNSPLNAPAGLTASVASFPITVGGAGTFPANGSPSIFSTITSAGGGTGGRDNNTSPATTGTAGGSGGGGGGGDGGGGSGNNPPVSPPQGNHGGGSTGGGTTGGGGGGGAGAVGNTGSPSTGANGGVGGYIADSFIGPTAPSYGESGPVSSTRYFAAGGGGGAGYSGGPGTAGNGGEGGGGNGSGTGTGCNGTTNTGGGGGGGKGGTGAATNGGSGIVMIRYKFQ
jgi:hypothetical protein